MTQKKRLFQALILVLVLLFVGSVFEKKLPIDPKVTVGTLENGLKYYVRQNKQPENRAELRLVVNAGSILEDEDQQGLAHFVEHMAFNGTEHFAKQELVEFMESIGMRFGPGLNAMTSFDETVYMLTIPMDSPEVIKTAFQILEDWSHALLFEEEEIDKERGVIIEEWRLGQGAWNRMRDKQYPILFKGSRYAERLPIGKKEIIESFDFDVLKRFYRDWYRPDLMAVIAVGDFDGSEVVALIEEHFAGLAMPDSPRARELSSVPDHDSTLVAIATDEEATSTSVSVYHKLPLREQETVGAFCQLIAERLYNSMLNQRFSEIVQKPDPPFLNAYSSRGLFVRSKEVNSLSAMVEESKILRGLEALFIESERVARFGFLQSELDRQKQEVLRSMERSYAEREKQSSRLYASEYIRSFLQGEPIPGIEHEFELYKKFIPEIELEEINLLGKKWITEKNRVILVNAPEKEGLIVPAEEELLDVLATVGDMEIEPYEDTTSDQPLLAEMPQPGEIERIEKHEDTGITEWELSNGVLVVLKPTDYKEDEILFRAVSPGGTSLSSDENYIPAAYSAQVVSSGGLGEFSAIDLRKKLSGKVANVRPSIGELEEGLFGSASPKDLETLFQLIYLSFTAPRADAAVFETLKVRMKAMLANQSASPEYVFYEKLQSLLTQNHPRERILNSEMVDEWDLEKSLVFYKDRFADASDFTFVFVGNLDFDSIRPLILRYLGGLPSIERKETWRDLGVDPPEGVIQETIRKGLEPKSQTSIVFTGPFEYNQDNRNAFRALTLVLQTRLRETLREDLGGTYSVGVSGNYQEIPDEEYNLGINFGSDPERVEELTKVVFKEIEDLKIKGVSEDEVENAREALYREYETGIKQNNWLLIQLYYRYRVGKDPGDLFIFEETLEHLSPEVIQEAARKYLNLENYVRLTLLPEREIKSLWIGFPVF
jgi:zinc protease